MAAILAGPDAVFIAALFFLAVIAGVMIVRPLLVSVLSNAPVIGGWLASNVDSGLAAYQRWLIGPANAALGALSSTLDWLGWAGGNLEATLTGFAQLAYAAGWRIVNLAIPAAEHRMTAFTQASISTASAALHAAIAAVAANASAAVAAARGEALSLFQTAEMDAAVLADAERAFAASLVAVAEQQAVDLAAAERAFVVDQVLAVDAQIETAFQRVLAITAASEATLGRDIGIVSDQLRGAIQQDVDALLKQIADDKEALTKALAGGLAGVLADIAAIRALRCIQQCNVLGELGEGLALVDIAAMIGLAELAVHDPGAFRGAWLTDVQPTLTSIGAEARAGFGL